MNGESKKNREADRTTQALDNAAAVAQFTPIAGYARAYKLARNLDNKFTGGKISRDLSKKANRLPGTKKLAKKGTKNSINNAANVLNNIDKHRSGNGNNLNNTSSKALSNSKGINKNSNADIARNTLSNMNKNGNASMKEKLGNNAANAFSAKHPVLGKALSRTANSRNNLKQKREIEDSYDDGKESFKISYKVIMTLAIMLVPLFALGVFMVLLIPSFQVYLIANTLGQADLVSDEKAQENIDGVKDDEEKLDEEVDEDDNDDSSENDSSSDSNSTSNNVSYIFDIFVDDGVNENIHYEFTKGSNRPYQEASLADLKEFYPEIINYTGDKYNQNDVYKFFTKLYEIYNHYKQEYKVELDIPLIMSVLSLQSSDMGEVFKSNTVGYKSIGSDNEDFSIDKDWSNYKSTKNNSAHDIEVLAQAMVKEGNSSESDNSSSATISKTGKEAVDKMNEIALKQAEEVHSGGQKFWSWYGFSYRDEWCAMFVSWLFNQVGGIDKYIKKSAVAGEIPRASVAAGYGTWYEDECTNSSTVPKPGDVIVFDPIVNGLYTPYPDNGQDKYYSSHVGYVYKVDDTKVYTVEGNAGDRVQTREYNRKTHCNTVGVQGINGYFRPNY